MFWRYCPLMKLSEGGTFLCFMIAQIWTLWHSRFCWLFTLDMGVVSWLLSTNRFRSLWNGAPKQLMSALNAKCGEFPALGFCCSSCRYFRETLCKWFRLPPPFLSLCIRKKILTKMVSTSKYRIGLYYGAHITYSLRFRCFSLFD